MSVIMAEQLEAGTILGDQATNSICICREVRSAVKILCAFLKSTEIKPMYR